MSEQLSAGEKSTLKTAAFGAVFLVSNADPGLLDMVEESFAASDALAGTTGLVREVLTTGGVPRLPSDDPAAVEAAVLPALRRSVEILQAKAPQELDNYRSTVVAAADRVANATDGVNPAEAAMVSKVRDALGVNG